MPDEVLVPDDVPGMSIYKAYVRSSAPPPKALMRELALLEEMPRSGYGSVRAMAPIARREPMSEELRLQRPASPAIPFPYPRPAGGGGDEQPVDPAYLTGQLARQLPPNMQPMTEERIARYSSSAMQPMEARTLRAMAYKDPVRFAQAARELLAERKKLAEEELKLKQAEQEAMLRDNYRGAGPRL
jgi:hypothetical protein